MSKKRTYKSYPKEFKEEAVALVREQGYTVSQAAEAVGVSSSLIRKWKVKLESDISNEVLSDVDYEELKQLRKEVKKLRVGKEILKLSFKWYFLWLMIRQKEIIAYQINKKSVIVNYQVGVQKLNIHFR